MENFDYRTDKLFYLPHAKIRMSQRNLNFNEIDQILRFGHHFHRAGKEIYFLAKTDIPDNKVKELSRLVGTTVIIIGHSVLTTFRNKKAIGRTKRQSKFKHLPGYKTQ